MQTTEAIYLEGVFRPEQALDLAEGSRVRLRVETPVASSGPSLIPDPPIATGERAAPFDLPLPGAATGVRARPGDVLLPDPPLSVD